MPQAGAPAEPGPVWDVPGESWGQSIGELICHIERVGTERGWAEQPPACGVGRGDPGAAEVARAEKDMGDREGCGDGEGHRGQRGMSGKFSSLPTREAGGES